MTGRAGAKDTRLMGDSSAQGRGMCGGEGNAQCQELDLDSSLGKPQQCSELCPPEKTGSLPSSAPGQDPWQSTNIFISGIDTKHITNLLPLAALEVFIPCITHTCWV